jgi:3-phosphoshikimate 1-carboxyvinyltransferase
MSLFVASLRCRHANLLEGYRDVNCSFPDFFAQFARLGVQCHEDGASRAQDSEHALLQQA